MNKVVLLLALLLAGPVMAQSNVPVGKPNPRHRALKENKIRRANDKATFRKERRPIAIDLHPHNESKFFTAKANRHYTSGKPGRNRATRTPDRPKLKVGKVALGRRGGRTSGN